MYRLPYVGLAESGHPVGKAPRLVDQVLVVGHVTVAARQGVDDRFGRLGLGMRPDPAALPRTLARRTWLRSREPRP